MKVHELEGVELALAVAQCVGDVSVHDTDPPYYYGPPLTWERCGPIIEREEISIYTQGYGEENWVAGYDFSLNEWDYGGQTGSGCSIEMNYSAFGSTPLIAAMRAFVSRADASAGKLEGVDQI